MNLHLADLFYMAGKEHLNLPVMPLYVTDTKMAIFTYNGERSDATMMVISNCLYCLWRNQGLITNTTMVIISEP